MTYLEAVEQKRRAEKIVKQYQEKRAYCHTLYQINDSLASGTAMFQCGLDGEVIPIKFFPKEIIEDIMAWVNDQKSKNEEFNTDSKIYK